MSCNVFHTKLDLFACVLVVICLRSRQYEQGGRGRRECRSGRAAGVHRARRATDSTQRAGCIAAAERQGCSARATLRARAPPPRPTTPLTSLSKPSKTPRHIRRLAAAVFQSHLSARVQRFGCGHLIHPEIMFIFKE